MFRSHEENTIPKTNREKIESFYNRTDIIYTMPGKGYEMVIGTENGKQKVCKHYLKENFTLIIYFFILC